jgi:glycosyltransferase involved in cell wall biosynthesis
MISIVTGTLDRIDYLKAVIENTVNSSDKLELVLVDGGSTDGTIDYIKSLNHPKINLIEFGKRSYYWDYMNLGVKHSKYEYVCQWNDDIILDGSWEDVFLELEKNTDFYLFSWDDGSGKYVIYDTDTEFVMNYGIYNKNIFRNVGLYNNSYKYYYCDGDMSYRAKSFGFSYKKLFNIRCKSLTTHIQKKAYMENQQIEESNYFRCLRDYDNKILPSNIELLH